MLTKEQILEKCRVQTKELDVPEIGGTIRIRELTIADTGLIAAQVAKLPEEQQSTQRVIRAVAAGIVDEGGKPMFTAEEVGAMHNRFELATVKIYRAIVGDEVELEKNSAATPIDSSSSK